MKCEKRLEAQPHQLFETVTNSALHIEKFNRKNGKEK